MKILVLGGTVLVGRHIVEAALAAGHEVTLFNRGQTHADLFPGVERLRGNRDPQIDEGLSALQGRRWDAVIDVNGYVPRVVKASAELLADQVDRYVYVSTLSVYDSPLPENSDEHAPLVTMDDPTSEDVRAHYGALKALCEQAAETAMPGRTLSLRLGLVSGAHDPTDRVTYWVWRTAQGGEMLVPASPESPFQTIDARDIADFTLVALKEGTIGVLNIAGPSVTWQEWLAACDTVTRGNPTLTWVDDPAFLAAEHPAEPRPYGALPMYIPPEAGAWWTVSSFAAQAAGLIHRPIEDTARAVADWLAERPADSPWKAGLTPEQEQAMLDAWHKRGS
ncbi:MAG: NAD-dependent epimerase/dehydratase family protein [Chloroflexi bacterium]|nr:NAD-dependent epimerase/dehydratase family protein [Chloroflexota bacterium]